MAEVNPEQRAIEEVYQLRAQRLARRPAKAASAAMMPALVFGLGAERYAIELSELAEVFPFRGCTNVPGSPAALLGVINVRGDIKPVADLRRLLALPAAGDADAGKGYVVMLREQRGAIGLKVDTVEGVRQIDLAQLLSASGGAAAPGSRFVKGLTADTVIVIDAGEALMEDLNGRRK